VQEVEIIEVKEPLKNIELSQLVKPSEATSSLQELFKQPEPAPTIQPQPLPSEQPVPIPIPIPEPLPQPHQPSPMPSPTPIPTPTPKRIPPIKIGDDQQSKVKKLMAQKGVITWRQGVKWEALPPPYRKEDLVHLDNPLPGTYKFAVGKGSAAKTLQVLYGSPPEDTDVDLGWATVRIKSKGNQLEMEFKGGKEAAQDRWAEEKALSELDKQSYDGITEGRFVEKIPRSKTLGLQKIELLEYQSGDIKAYLVNGEYIRNELSKSYPDAIDFTQGNHFRKASYIPDNEVWVDRALDSPIDRKATLLHELREVQEMGKGISYEEAHSNIANPLELKARHNPELVDEFLEEEMKRAKREVENDTEYKPKPKPQPPKSGRYYLGRRLRPPNLNISF
jgi:hypothetical protein